MSRRSTARRQSDLPGGRPVVFFRTARPDATDPRTGRRYTDVIMFWVPSESDKQARPLGVRPGRSFGSIRRVGTDIVQPGDAGGWGNPTWCKTRVIGSLPWSPGGGRDGMGSMVAVSAAPCWWPRSGPASWPRLPGNMSSWRGSGCGDGRAGRGRLVSRAGPPGRVTRDPFEQGRKQEGREHQRQEYPEPAPYSTSGIAGPLPLQGVAADDGDDPPGGQGGDDCL